jgi:hypothetical protein
MSVLEHALCRSDTARLRAIATTAVERHGAHVRRSRSGLDYHVVAGNDVRAWVPALFELYREPGLVGWLQALTADASVSTSTHLRSSININCLRRRGQAYPWHRDAVSYSAVLFLNSLQPNAGGELQIERLDGVTEAIPCAAGTLIVFDGHLCRHAIAPLNSDAMRLTVPMVFPNAPAERPAGLDRYLYGTPDPD